MTKNEFVRRFLWKDWNISDEEFYRLYMEYVAKCEELNNKSAQWMSAWIYEFQKYYPDSGEIKPGTFKWDLYSRFMTDKLNVWADRINKRFKGFIEIYVKNENGKPMIHGKSKLYPNVAF